MEWRIGCSGFHYPEWRKVFYPEDVPQRRWFEYYSDHFNTLELNGTYYRFPRVESLKSWYGRSPGQFDFTVKAPRFITHYKKFKDAQRMLNDFSTAVKEGLKEKVACVLFQFPANFHYDPERLQRIISLADPSLRSVVEFRDESWWRTDVFDDLRKASIAFCGMSHPRLPDDVIATTDFVYYRFHGVPHLYSSKYEISKLEQTVLDFVNVGSGKPIYVYFNNTADGHAIQNAKQLQEISELVHDK